MELSEENKLQLVSWLREKDIRCPCCAKSKFVLAEEIYKIHPWNQSDSAAVPAVLMLCDNCSVIIPFSPIKMGIVQGPKMWVVD